MFTRKLACSFCGKDQADVAKLVAGPRVYICDQCAAQVIRIMEASGDDEPKPSPLRRGLLRRVSDRFGEWFQKGAMHESAFRLHCKW